MCGIAGKLHWQPILDNNPVYKMSECLTHRRLDEMGSLILENITLGFMRFSILDLPNKANQPNLFPNRINEMIDWSLKESILIWEWSYYV